MTTITTKHAIFDVAAALDPPLFLVYFCLFLGLAHSFRGQTGPKRRANNMVPFKIDNYVLKCLLKAIR